jgi:hypothetical protein
MISFGDFFLLDDEKVEPWNRVLCLCLSALQCSQKKERALSVCWCLPNDIASLLFNFCPTLK